MLNNNYFTFNNYEEEPSDISTLKPCGKFNSFDVHSPQYSGSPYQDESLSEKSKKIRKKRNTYQKIDDETRIKLLDAVQQGDTLKAAARRFNINYSSAKSILHTFRKEGRILKKSAQERTVRKRSKTSQEMTMSPIYLNQFQGNYNDVPENNYKFCASPAINLKPEISPIVYESTDGSSPRQGVSGVPINSFSGGYVRVDPERHQQRVENLNLKTPSTVAFNLESQHMQNMPTMERKTVQSGNWQLNVNIHSDNNMERGVRSLNFTHEPQYIMNHPQRVPERFRNVENSYEGYSVAPVQQVQGRNRREVLEQNPPRFIQREANAYSEIPFGMEDVNMMPREPGYDVSCYLNSAPTYSYPQRGQEMVVQMEHHPQLGNIENMPPMENRVFAENQNMRYGGLNKTPYMNGYVLKMDETNPALMKTAGLRSY